MVTPLLDLHKFHLDPDPVQQLMADLAVMKMMLDHEDRVGKRHKKPTTKCLNCGGDSRGDPYFCSLECANLF